MKDIEVKDEPPSEISQAYDFLFLFDKASGSPKVNYFMVDPRHPSQIFPKMNVFTMNAVKGICGYCVVVLDNCIYILGGKDWETGKHVADVSRFNPSTNVCEKLSPMKSPRCRFSAEVVGSHVYVVGGETKKGRITDSVERYDPSTDTWVDVKGLPRPRADHASCSVGGNLYVTGGISNLKHQSSNVFWLYNPDDDVWSEVSEGLAMPKEREKHNMVPVSGSAIFILGGRSFDHETFMEKDEGSVCQYSLIQEPDARRGPPWELSHAPLPHTRTYAGAVALGKNIWVFGGFSHSAASQVSRVAVYDTLSRRWHETFSLPPGNFTNVELCRLSIPVHNTSFTFLDKYICNKWVLW
ncbi:kelch-like protein 14 isoform X2 [Haliotis asinina]|uniref:kelch-like protein 14 isoform X2 n=1 Tax=Haliotis asinina TaxID=109174 RepID=UPI003531EFE3